MLIMLPTQGWTERPIFGKIRYMNYAGCKRKFNIPAYVAYVDGAVRKEKAAAAAAAAAAGTSGTAASGAGASTSQAPKRQPKAK